MFVVLASNLSILWYFVIETQNGLRHLTSRIAIVFPQSLVIGKLPIRLWLWTERRRQDYVEHGHPDHLILQLNCAPKQTTKMFSHSEISCGNPWILLT